MKACIFHGIGIKRKRELNNLILQITCEITHTLHIYRMVPLPINKGVFIVFGWCMCSNMCAVNCFRLIHSLCLTPLSAIFQLYQGDQFLWWKKPKRTTGHGQASGNLYPLRLRDECTLFVIYKAEREPMLYW